MQSENETVTFPVQSENETVTFPVQSETVSFPVQSETVTFPVQSETVTFPAQLENETVSFPRNKAVTVSFPENKIGTQWLLTCVAPRAEEESGCSLENCHSPQTEGKQEQEYSHPHMSHIK